MLISFNNEDDERSCELSRKMNTKWRWRYMHGRYVDPVALCNIYVIDDVIKLITHLTELLLVCNVCIISKHYELDNMRFVENN